MSPGVRRSAKRATPPFQMSSTQPDGLASWTVRIGHEAYARMVRLGLMLVEAMLINPDHLPGDSPDGPPSCSEAKTHIEHALAARRRAPKP